MSHKKEKIKKLYQLRHFCNVNSFCEATKEVFLKEEYIEDLYYSDIHGSTTISHLRNKNFLEEFEKLENEQEEIDERIEESEYRNYQLVQLLSEKRLNFCDIGTNKVKRRLTKISSTISLAYRIALEIEDVNIKAKDTSDYYKQKVYDIKNHLILDLVKLCDENGWNYGIQKDKTNKVHSQVIFFELPNCEQISWHFTLKTDFKKYEKEWDGKINSTLDKLEFCIKQFLIDNRLDK